MISSLRIKSQIRKNVCSCTINLNKSTYCYSLCGLVEKISVFQVDDPGSTHARVNILFKQIDLVPAFGPNFWPTFWTLEEVGR